MTKKYDLGTNGVSASSEKEQDAFKNLVDELPLGILSCDREGNITAVNDFLLNILGSPSAEATKKVNMLTFSPLVESGIASIIKETIATGRNTSIETPYKSMWGKELFLSFRVFPLKNEKGEVSGCHAIIEDLTTELKANTEIEDNRLKDSLIEQILNRFINSSFRDIDRNINLALKDLGYFIDAERVVFFSVADDEGHIIKTHEWHAEGVISKIPLYEKLDSTTLVFDDLDNLQTIHISNIDDLPGDKENLRQMFRNLDIKSVAMIPLSRHGIFKGFLAVDSKSKIHTWKENELYLLKIVGDILINVLERQKSEVFLLKREQEFEEIIDSLNAVIWKATFDMDGNLLNSYISKPVDNVLGLPEGTIGNDWNNYFAHIHHEDLHEVLQAFKKSFLQPETPIELDYRLVSNNGEIAWVNSAGSAYLQDDGTILTYGTSVSITDRKLAADKIAQSEERYRSLVEQLNDAVFINDLEGNILEVNKSACEMLGYSKEELKKITLYDLLIPENRRRGQEVMKKLQIDGILRGDTQYVTASGDIIDVEISARLLEGQHGIAQGVVRDITERKKAENELRRSEKKYRSLIERLSDAVIINTFEGQIIEVNDKTCEMLGYSREELQNMTIYDLMPPERRKSAKKNMNRFIKKGNILAESRFVTADGKLLIVEVNAKALEGYHNIAQAIVRDITERKKAEEKLRESEALLNEVGRIAKIGGWEVNLVTGESTWTTEVARIHDLDFDEAVGVELGMDYYPSPSRKIIEKAFSDAVEKGEPYDLELEFTSAKGNHKWVRASGRPAIENGRVTKVIGSFQDITERKHAEEKLHESEALLNEVGKIAKIGGWQYDTESNKFIRTPEILKIYETNETYSTLGEPLKYYIPESKETLQKAFDNAVDRGESYDLELEIITDKGKHKWVRASGYPKIVNEKVVNITGTLQDITEIKSAEEEIIRSETKYRSLFEQSNDAIILHDFHGSIIDANRKACEMFRYSEDELKQKSILELIIPDEREETIQKMPELLLKGSMRNESRLMRSDGKILHLDVSASVSQAQTNLVQAVGRDITDRIKAEADMLQAKIEAETASRTKSEFLANMSHELRTPLNSIIGFSEVMLDGLTGELGPKQEHYMHHISNSGRHLLTLINDILDISKIEAGKMELNFEILDVRRTIDEIVTNTSSLTSEKRLTVAVEVPENIPGMRADRAKFKQIIYNILGNAIKFTESGGNITIRAWTDGKIIRISVIDTGIGISQEDQTKLFKPFSQIDSSISRRYEGTGLGLALVKELVELHGGKIWVESQTGKGSDFTFEMPVEQKYRYDNN